MREQIGLSEKVTLHVQEGVQAALSQWGLVEALYAQFDPKLRI
jgi:hypothetical protein